MVVQVKVNEIRKLSNEELVSKISENKKELLELRFKQATGALDKPNKVRELRKELARMKTILREREVEVGGTK